MVAVDRAPKQVIDPSRVRPARDASRLVAGSQVDSISASLLGLQAQAGNGAVASLVAQLQPTVTDPLAEPSALWLDANDAHRKLTAQIGLINQTAHSPTRSEWLGRIESSWQQIGAPGEKTDAELERLRTNVTGLKAEIAEEAAQAFESWKVVKDDYVEELRLLGGEDASWREDASKLLTEKYKSTERAVQVSGGYLTFDDLKPLEHWLNEKKHREYARTRAEQQAERDATTSAAMGAGLGAVVTYQGKTLVRLGGEKFYVSGVPPKGSFVPKGGTTSVLFIYKKSDPKKMYRLDYDTIKMGPKQGKLGWEHNQKGVAKVLNLKVTNHQPAGGWGRAAGTAVRIYKWGGRALFIAGLVGSAIEIYHATNKRRALAKTGGALAGGLVGAKLGAVGGAKAGAFFGPVGAAIGAGLGGLLGGALGAWGGSKATEYVYDLIVQPVESEEEWVILSEDQVEPVGTTK